MVEVRHLVVMAKVKVRSEGMHYVSEGPHKDRSTITCGNVREKEGD